jgi:hypothetical protein
MLYAQATHDEGAGKVRKIRLRPEDQARLAALASEEGTIWSAAVSYYARHYSQRDLLFDDHMVAIGHALSALEDRPLDGEAIPQELRQVLARAAPIYRKHWWPDHQEANLAWRDRLEPLLAAHGNSIRDRLIRLFAVPWPAAPIPVDLIIYANWAGAYTSLGPTRIAVATSDPHNQGVAALEIMMHESAHGMMTPLRDNLQHIVAAELARPGARAAAIRRDLWHELLFYIVGRAVAEAVPNYVPYADRNELWKYAWPGPDRYLIEKNLTPYFDGASTLDKALSALVRDLSSSPAD